VLSIVVEVVAEREASNLITDSENQDKDRFGAGWRSALALVLEGNEEQAERSQARVSHISANLLHLLVNLSLRVAAEDEL